ncbi:MAG: M20/M25/M40 family metallo-hydrolase [Solirubrobacterales bacterium]
MDRWIAEHARRLTRSAPEQIARLVDAPSPNGEADGARACLEILRRLLPSAAAVSGDPSSTSGYADDLRATVTGTGRGRLLLLGHVDTVIPRADHRPATRDGSLLRGSGTYDMKGGLVVAAAIMRALAARADLYESVTLRCVADEEWRDQPLRISEPDAAIDACLCFEGGERIDGDEAIVVRRKGAAVLTVDAEGGAAHAGASADQGRSALAALARLVGELGAAEWPADVTVVPTVLSSGDAINVVPATGRLACDVRTPDPAGVAPVLHAAVPDRVGEVLLASDVRQRFPALDARTAAQPLLDHTAGLLARPVRPASRGGSSDAAFLGAHVPLTIDGLGPLGGGDHSPREHVELDSLADRIELALACAVAALGLEV